MPYSLPPLVNTHQKMFAIPAAQIPAGLATTPGLMFIQFNTHRLELRMQNVAAAGSFVWIGSRENGFADAYRINGGESLIYEFAPRTPMFAWTTGTAPDFRYSETVWEEIATGRGGIRSNVQNP